MAWTVWLLASGLGPHLFAQALPGDEPPVSPPVLALPSSPSEHLIESKPEPSTPLDVVTQDLSASIGRSLAALPAPGATDATPFFRIGFLRPADENALGRDWYEGLRDALLGNKAFSSALRLSGFRDVALRSCDGPDDMLQRMGQVEFEIIFCPAMAFVQDRIAGPETPRYQVLYQTRRRGSDQPDSRGGPPRRQGVLFTRRGSEIDRTLGTGALVRLRWREEIGDYISAPDRAFAVSGTYDAASYFYMRKLFWEEYEASLPREILFYGTPERVVKAVVCGLADVGACEEAALREVLGPLSEDSFSSDDNPYVRVLARTQWLPTDPVLIRAEYHPGQTGAPLGRAIAEVLREFYNQASENAPLLEKPRNADYETMIDDVRLTQGYE